VAGRRAEEFCHGVDGDIGLRLDEKERGMRDPVDARPLFDEVPFHGDVSSLLWSAPRQAVEGRLPVPPEGVAFEYTIGMTPDESAFVCGIIRERSPKKILEIGVRKGGTTAVILEALDRLGLDATLYSVDLDPNLPAGETLRHLPELTGRLRLMYGRDVSAFLDEIGGDIDLCVIDTAHYLPGEVLTFACVLPYLRMGATVVVHDQVCHFDVANPYVQTVGPEAYISCRVLFDTVVADKLVPNLFPGRLCLAPNIGSFVVTPDTRKYARHLFSALMLPWRGLPGRQYLADVIRCLTACYPGHYVEYFKAVVKRQIAYHLDQSQTARHYWTLTMMELAERHGLANVAFYGAGGYCEQVVLALPAELRPARLIDRNLSASPIAGIPVHGFDSLAKRPGDIRAIVITSRAHHREIFDTLAAIPGGAWEIVDPFIAPAFDSWDLAPRPAITVD
jgi:predicted O-methyltransferase YrrM